jgi:tryptophanyl-tRNA synthetase
VDSHTLDKDYIAKGGLFPIVDVKLGRVKRLVGIGPPGPQGNLLKMSKSLNNAIFLSDDADAIAKKIKAMYTDPKRLKVTDPGTTENNPLWIYHDTFNPDKAWVEEAKARYRAGEIGDVECKKKLIEILVSIIGPIQQRRMLFEKDPGQVVAILKDGTARANTVANETLKLAKIAMRQDYFL